MIGAVGESVWAWIGVFWGVGMFWIAIFGSEGSLFGSMGLNANRAPETQEPCLDRGEINLGDQVED